MKKENILFVLIMAFLIFGCTAPLTPALLPVESQTQPTQPTFTPSPTITQRPATPIITPESSLRTNGPYFAYFRQVPGFYAFQFVLMDADGRGRKVIDLPDEITDSLYQLGARYVSPNGKWLAFYAGYAGEFYGGATQSTFDLTLNLLSLDTGKAQVITPLLSQDYPDNFIKAVKEINDPHIRPEDLQTTFLAGVTQALAWSPDGRYLAFAGQMEGLSSDLYLYDMTTKEIQRLSNDNEELQWVNWSPDGKWILYGSRKSSIDEWIEYSIYAVARDNSSIHNLGPGFTGGWLNSHEILEYRFGIETYQLRLVEVDTGNLTEIWEGYFNGYEVDPTGTWVVLVALSSTIPPEEEKPGFVYGATQLINLKSLEEIQTPDLVSDPPDLFVHAKDGNAINLPHSIEMILASPDTKYWAVAIQNDIKIYTQDLTLVTEISVPLQDTNSNDMQRPDDMQWSPNSSGLFLVYGTNIYHVNISDGEVSLVETNLPYGYDSASGWINGQ